MTKTKIVFAGVMGAILMSVGANAATITSVATKGYVDQEVGATKGYVDQEVGKVQTTVDNLGNTYVTMQQVADAIGASLENGKIDLSRYQLTDNMVTTTLANVVGDDKNTKYPSVGAVLDAIDAKISALDLSPEQIASLKELLGSEGVVASINKLQGQVDTLKSSVDTLKGDKNVDGSVAKSIVDAISAHKTEADKNYQAKSTAAYSFGTADGGWESLSGTQLNALNSGITADKVTAYDELTGEDGKVTTITNTVSALETLIKDENTGLQKKVSDNASAISTNTANIATNTGKISTNTSNIAKNAEDISGINANIGEGFSATNTVASALNTKVTIPESCASGAEACVPMLRGNAVTWTPLTIPVDDPQQSGTPSGTPNEAQPS